MPRWARAGPGGAGRPPNNLLRPPSRHDDVLPENLIYNREKNREERPKRAGRQDAWSLPLYAITASTKKKRMKNVFRQPMQFLPAVRQHSKRHHNTIYTNTHARARTLGQTRKMPPMPLHCPPQALGHTKNYNVQSPPLPSHTHTNNHNAQPR